MNVRRMLSARWITAALVAVATIGAVGCSEPAQTEKQGSRTAKLLAPKAIFKAKASAETKKTLGIVEWRVYRGKRDIVLTGYDANGKAKKGVSVGFHKAEKGVKASLRARVLDGTMFAARHEFGGATKANGKMSKETATLLGHAFHDARAIRAHLLPSKGEVPLPGTGSIPSGPTQPQQDIPGLPPGGAQCGGDLMSIVMAAMQCIQQQGGTAQQCVAAAQAASGLGGACQGGPMDPQMPPYDPSQGGGPYDPCGGAGGMGGDYPGGEYPDDMGYPGEGPMGVGMDEGGMCGPMGGGAGDYPGEDGMGDGYPGEDGWEDDPYGDGGEACPSCQMGDDYGDDYGDGYGDDIYGDMDNGDVGYEDGGGDYGDGW